MNNISNEERALFESSSNLTNVVHVLVLALGRVSHTIPREIDGVAYTNVNIARMLTTGIVAKVQENDNAEH